MMETVSVDRFTLAIKNDEVVTKSDHVQLDETVQLQTLKSRAEEVDQKVQEKVKWRDYK